MSDTKQIDDGGPVFPQPTSDGSSSFKLGNLTLRDWFAGQAMAEQTKFAVSSSEQYNAAKRCYTLADAMLAARKEKV